MKEREALGDSHRKSLLFGQSSSPNKPPQIEHRDKVWLASTSPRLIDAFVQMPAPRPAFLAKMTQELTRHEIYPFAIGMVSALGIMSLTMDRTGLSRTF